MDNTLTYTINVSGNAQSQINNITHASQNASSNVVSLSQRIMSIGFAIQHISAAYNKFSGYINAAKQASLAQSVAETRLSAVMRQTIGASNDEIESIKQLASAQQRVGVIGDEVMLGGAQEIATYVEKTSSIKKLIPAINDMAAQQYGLNASQEQYTQIATMVGKVMQGQTGALSRYGYGFTEAQEKILKTGTEAQRAAVLFDVVSESVGGFERKVVK